MTENSYKILQYLQKHNGATALEVAQALNMEKRLVDSYFSAGIIRNGLGMRDEKTTPAKLLLNELGKQKVVKPM